MRIIIPIVVGLVGIAVGWFLSPSGDSPDSGLERQVASGGGSAGPPRAELGDPAEPDRSIEQNLTLAFASGRVNYTEMKELMTALSTMSPANISQFATFFNQQPFQKPQLTLWQMFFSAWGDFDPGAAVAFIDQKFPTGAARRLFYASVIETWKGDDFAAVLEFAMEKFPRTDDLIDNQLALDYLNGLAERDPDQALALAMQLGDGEMVLDMTAKRISELSKIDRNTALEAVELLTGDAHFHAASQFVMDWATEEPAVAAEWLLKNYDQRYALHVVGQVAKAFIKADPLAAMAWIKTIPDESSRPAILGEAMREWAQADPAAAAAWLENGASSAEHDPALVAFGQQLSSSGSQREVLEEWVPKISDPRQGNALLYEISLEWERSNPAEYTRWLEETEVLSPEVKQRLMARELPGPAASEGEGGDRAAPAGEASTGIDQGRDR